MSISGNLKTMQLAEILQWLSHARKTGSLIIDNGTIEKRIFFEEGKIISSAASDPKEYLGHFLVSHGYLDEVTLAKAMEMQDENRMLLGKILVTIGAISQEELEEMLRLKAEESIYEIFTWPEGEFRFLENELPDFTMVPLELSVEGLILEGHQRVDEYRRIRATIPSVHAVAVAVGALEPPKDRPRARKILELVNDDRTVQEIAMQTHCGEFHVRRVLYEQLRKGRLKMVRPRGEPSGGREHSGAVGAVALLETAKSFVDERRFDLALRYLQAARNLEPHGQRVQQAAKKAEEQIEQALLEDGVVPDAVPQLEVSMEEVASLSLSPQEGFILTRIDGSYDVRTILKISPMPPLEARVVLWKLARGGYITLLAEG